MSSSPVAGRCTFCQRVLPGPVVTAVTAVDTARASSRCVSNFAPSQPLRSSLRRPQYPSLKRKPTSKPKPKHPAVPTVSNRCNWCETPAVPRGVICSTARPTPPGSKVDAIQSTPGNMEIQFLDPFCPFFHRDTHRARSPLAQHENHAAGIRATFPSAR